MSNTSYIRLLNKAKVNNDRIYYNLNIPVDICNDLRLETGDKILIKQHNDNIIIKRADV
ncbi:MAG: AbrB/MazE/SpoVT family DNA-binding domain-containing protein [Nitrososphaerales archaeon]